MQHRAIRLMSILMAVILISACESSAPGPSGGYPAPAATEVKPTTSPTSIAAAYPGPGPQRELKIISFNTSDNVKLTSTLYTPNVNRAPAVILFHKVDGSRKDWDSFAQSLQRTGYVVLAVDFRGHGDSSGSRDWEKMTQDVAAAWAYVIGLGTVDTSKVVLLGASIGGNLALNYAATEPSVKAVGMLSPGLDYQNVKTENAMKGLGSRPVLMLSGSEDSYSVDSQKKLEALATGPKQTQVFPNAGHGTDMLKVNAVVDALLAWLKSVTA